MDVITPEGDVKSERLGVRIDATFVSKLNLADFQNAVPMIRALSITNASLVFEWLYNLLRLRLEAKLSHRAEHWVNEYKNGRIHQRLSCNL